MPGTGGWPEYRFQAKGQTGAVKKDKDSGAKGRSEAVSEARDWDVSGVFL